MERKLPWILIALLTVVYGFSIIAKDFFIADWFTTDDAFYYFKVAENIVSGLGSTFDGISKVNGYHPLWLLVLVPIFFLSGSEQFMQLRSVMIFQYLLSIGMVWIFYHYLRKWISAQSSFLIALLWIFYFPFFATLTNGTESLLNAFALTLFWVIYNQNISSDRWEMDHQGIIQIGLTALLLVFSRLDNVFILIVFGVWLCYKFLTDVKWKISLKAIVELAKLEILYFGPTTLLLGIYLLVNKLTIGTFMPLSGQIKRYWGSFPDSNYGSKVAGIGSYLGEFFSENINIGPFSLFLNPIYSLMDKLSVSYFYGTKSLSLGLIVVFLLFVLMGYLVGRKEDLTLKLVDRWSLIPLSLAVILHVSYYKLGGYLAPRSWYWILEAFLILLILGVVIEALFASLQDWSLTKSPILAYVLVLFLSVLVLIPHAEQISRKLTSTVSSQHQYIQKTRWLEENTESGTTIGMTGAGTTSYFIDDRVIMNLDGLMNGLVYFLDLQDNQAVDYLKEHQVEYIFGNDYIMLDTEPYRSNFREILKKSDVLDTYDDKLVLWKLNY
ncbi:MAG: hypothetical protein ACK2TT_05380 [Anaerolineales bacterium]